MTKRCSFCAEEIQAAAVICRFCNREQRFDGTTSTSSQWLPYIIMSAVAVLLGGGILVSYYGYLVEHNLNNTASQSLVPVVAPPPPPLEVAVASEPYQRLNAGAYAWYPFELNDSRACRLRGHIQVTEGGSHDVDVFLTDQDGFQNFQNGNQFYTYLNEHRTSALTLELPVSGYKRYYLVVSNRFSMFTGKSVSLENVRGVCGDLDGGVCVVFCSFRKGPFESVPSAGETRAAKPRR